MYAVIKTGGKQYRVAANDTITVEKLIGDAGEHVHFTDVLMVADGEKIEVGAPLVTGATVVGEIADQVKSPTVYIFKKRRRKHHRRRNGHRQLLTSVRITDILTGGAKPSTKAAAPKATSSSTSRIVETVKGAAKQDAGEQSVADGVKADDISLIAGIGPKIEKALHEKGITTWAQIANLKVFEIENLNTELKLMGRIDREEWVAQAKELMAGKPPRAKTDKARKDQE